MAPIDHDNDAVAQRMRDVLGDVTVGDADAEFITLYFPADRAITAVNLVGTRGMSVHRQRQALLVALLQLDPEQ